MSAVSLSNWSFTRECHKAIQPVAASFGAEQNLGPAGDGLQRLRADAFSDVLPARKLHVLIRIPADAGRATEGARGPCPCSAVQFNSLVPCRSHGLAPLPGPRRLGGRGLARSAPRGTNRSWAIFWRFLPSSPSRQHQSGRIANAAAQNVTATNLAALRCYPILRITSVASVRFFSA